MSSERQAHLHVSVLLADPRQLIETARLRADAAVNAELTLLYWRVGNRVNNENLQGERAEYGQQVVKTEATQFAANYGKGWSERQVRYSLRTACMFPDENNLHTLYAELRNHRPAIAHFLRAGS